MRRSAGGPPTRRSRLVAVSASFVLVVVTAVTVATVVLDRDPAAAWVAPPGFTERVSLTSGGAEYLTGPGSPGSNSSDQAISDDGRWVVFDSGRVLDERDVNPFYDVYLHDRFTGRTHLVSRYLSEEGGDIPTWGSSGGESVNPAISGNGRFIAFQSRGTAFRMGYGAPGTFAVDDSRDDVFVYDRDPDGDGVFAELETEADLAAEPLRHGTITRMPTEPTTVGTSAYDDADDDFSAWHGRDVSLSTDGRYLAYQVTLTAGETMVIPDVMVLDRDDDGDGVFAPFDEPGAAFAHTLSALTGGSGQYSGPEITGDGRRVVATDETGSVVVFDLDPDGNGEWDGDLDGDGFWDPDRFRLDVIAASSSTADTSTFYAAPALSADGRVVAYTRFDQIGGGSTTNPAIRSVEAVDRGEADVTGAYTGSPTVLAVSEAPGDPALDRAEGAAVSADGRYVAYHGLEYVGDSAAEVFLRDLQHLDHGPILVTATPELERSEVGETATGISLLPDGAAVVFTSDADDLVAGPDDGFDRDVFVRTFDPLLVGSPDPVEFGDVVVGTTAEQVVTFTNEGIGSLGIGGVGLGGGPPFAIAHDGCTGQTLPAGGSCEVVVSFTPTELGPAGADLQVYDDQVISDAVGFFLTEVDLDGTGVPPPPDPPEFQATPNPAEFGTHLVGALPPPVTITAANVGGGSLYITGVGVVGLHADDYSIIDHDCDGYLDVERPSCTVVVQFAPSAAGLREAVLQFGEYFGPATYTVDLRGTGRVATPVFRADPLPLDMGSTLVGTTTAPRVLRAHNDGDAPFTVTAVGLEGTDPGSFAIATDGCTGAVVAPGGSCALTVRFAPDRADAHAAHIRFTDTAPGTPHLVTVQGWAIARPDPGDPDPDPDPGDPVLRAEPDPLDFGEVLAGRPTTGVVTVTNDGTSPLALASIPIEGEAASEFTVTATTCLVAALAPGDTCAITIAHVPTATGDRTASLRITSNDPTGPHAVGLRSTVLVPELDVNPSVGQPGAVVTAVGRNWPPGATVTLSWFGMDQQFQVDVADDGTFTYPDLLVFPRSQLGTRQAVGATELGDDQLTATAPFLVVPATVDGTPQFVFRG